jgi:phenylpropionate dioxygenase-like ring-hydroxylating dioxygenase large terminal subunit
VPVRELASQLWIFTAPGADAPSEPQVHEALLRPGVRVSGFAVEWKTHWTRAMENMLDWPHLPFVHTKTIGRSMVGQSASRMDITWDEEPWGARTRIAIDGKAQEASLDLRWPNQMNLHISPPGKLMIMMVACVPVDGERTRLLVTMARDFMTSPIFDPFFHWANARIASEDKEVVESSFPVEIPPPGEERSVRTDGPTLAFRKRYYAELRGSSSGAVPMAHSTPKRALPLAG